MGGGEGLEEPGFAQRAIEGENPLQPPSMEAYGGAEGQGAGGALDEVVPFEGEGGEGAGDDGLLGEAAVDEAVGIYIDGDEERGAILG